MHQGRPYGLHAIGGKLTDHDEAFISVMAKRFSNLKDLSSIDSSRMVYDLPNGGYVVIQDMGGNFRVIAHKTSRVDQIVFDGVAIDYIPMLYSGVVLNPTPFADAGVPMRLTEVTRRRLSGYDPNANLPAKQQTLNRFRVEYNPKFKYFEPVYKGNTFFSQYAKQRATWYSGAMSEVVQIVGGYGKQDLEGLPDSTMEQATFRLPLPTINPIRIEVANKRLPGYTGVPNTDGQYQYSYDFNLCHGVAFDLENKPWLLQVAYNGLYAMPLPLIPATTTASFREYIESVGDDEILYILDRFGGMPSGESFPIGKGFQAWLRAGVIIKLCDTKQFYENSPFYLACGWAFNSRGSEAFNTCWSYDDRGMKHAHAYKIKISLGAAINSGWVDSSKPLDGEDAGILNDYISNLFGQLTENTNRERAIRYKIMRQPNKDLLTHAKNNTGDINYWENFIDKPIANHSANLVMISSGPAYWAGKFVESFGALKFPEFTGNGCESFDMTALDYKGPAVRCNAIVFGCYINDQLNVVMYFKDTRQFTRKTISNFEDIMLIGSWQATETSGYMQLQGNFYTSVFDDREVNAQEELVTKITGVDLGYATPQFWTPPLMHIWGTLSRYRYFSYRTESTLTTSPSINVAVCVPSLTRDCVLYAYDKQFESRIYRDKMQLGSMKDATSYRIWTYDFIYHFIGGKGIGKPSPTMGERVYANYDPEYDYNSNSDYAFYIDSGNWYGVPEGGFIDVSGICSKYTSRSAAIQNVGGVTIGGAPPQIKEYSTAVGLPARIEGKVNCSIKIAGAATINKELPSSFYYNFSPYDTGAGLLYFQKDATWITAGNQEYSNTSEEKTVGKRAYWGSTKLADHKSAHCFIGVINE